MTFSTIFSGLFNISLRMRRTLFYCYFFWNLKILFDFPGGCCWASCPKHTKIFVRFWSSLSLFGKYCTGVSMLHLFSFSFECCKLFLFFLFKKLRNLFFKEESGEATMKNSLCHSWEYNSLMPTSPILFSCM